MDWQPLIDAARDARERSYSPYSRFKVGAALLMDDGTPDGALFAGCNVENRSYGLCICGERNAVAQAVAAGYQTLRAVAVVTDTSPPALPCGMCLETLTEFAKDDIPVIATNLAGARVEVTLRQLHPFPFEWPEELEAGNDP